MEDDPELREEAPQKPRRGSSRGRSRTAWMISASTMILMMTTSMENLRKSACPQTFCAPRSSSRRTTPCPATSSKASRCLPASRRWANRG